MQVMAVTADSIAAKRSVLFAARLRLAPETQPVREMAIERMVEQALLALGTGNNFTVEQIERQGMVTLANGVPAIGRRDIKAALERLAARGRLDASKAGQSEAYTLAPVAAAELRTIQQDATMRLGHAVLRLFEEPGAAATYALPFLECLSTVFSRLGATYVRSITDDATRRDLSMSTSIAHAAASVARRNPGLDQQLLEAALRVFFSEANPDYDVIKWNMAQNYYVAHALGYGHASHLLSKEVFGDGVFYLDTNVIVHALDPRSRYHAAFLQIAQACSRLGIKLVACERTLTEFATLVARQQELLAKVKDQIPEALAGRVKNEFYQAFREQAAMTGNTNVEALFAAFDQPRDALAEAYNVELVDEPWFAQAEDDAKTKQYAQKLKQEYDRRRGRPKRWNSAVHDALVLTWVAICRVKGANKTWFVTLDTSLPGVYPEVSPCGERPLAITLDALVHWLSPLAQPDDDDGLASIFAEVVKHRLLPQDCFFDLKDFQVFAELEIECQQLPAEDVEGCIKQIKANAPALDPSEPSDREKLSREIARFFADPGTKYRSEVHRLQAEVDRKDALLASQAREAKDRQQQVLAEMQRKDEDTAVKLSERDHRMAQMEAEREARAEEDRVAGIKHSAIVRLVLLSLGWLVVVAATVWAAATYGKGDNEMQRIVSMWQLVLASIGSLPFAGWFVLGEERLTALGWRAGKVLKK